MAKRKADKPLKISTQMGYRHIRAFEAAVREHEMKGAQHTDDRAAIQEQYDKAKERLTHFMVQSVIGNEEPQHTKGCGCHYCD